MTRRDTNHYCPTCGVRLFNGRPRGGCPSGVLCRRAANWQVRTPQPDPQGFCEDCGEYIYTLAPHECETTASLKTMAPLMDYLTGDKR